MYRRENTEVTKPPPRRGGSAHAMRARDWRFFVVEQRGMRGLCLDSRSARNCTPKGLTRESSIQAGTTYGGAKSPVPRPVIDALPPCIGPGSA